MRRWVVPVIASFVALPCAAAQAGQAWSPSQQLSSKSAFAFEWAANARGDALALWASDDGLHASERKVGEQFGTPVLYKLNKEPQFLWVDVALINESGDRGFILNFLNGEAFAAVAPRGRGFGGLIKIPAKPATAEGLRADIDSAGNVLVVWAETEGEGADWHLEMRGAWLRAGSDHFDQPFTVPTTEETEPESFLYGRLHVAFLENDVAAVVWPGHKGALQNTSSVHASFGRAGSGFSAPTTLAGPGGVAVLDMEATRNGLMVLGRTKAQPPGAMEAAFRRPGEDFSPVTTIGNDPPLPWLASRIAVGYPERALIVWQRDRMLVGSLLGPDGFGPERPLGRGIRITEEWYGDIALDRFGNLLAVYQNESGHWVARTLDLAGTWSLPAVISPASSEPGGAEVATDENGGGLAVWNRWDGQKYVVEAAYYNGPAFEASVTPVITALRARGMRQQPGASAARTSGTVRVRMSKRANAVVKIAVRKRKRGCEGSKRRCWRWKRLATYRQWAPKGRAVIKVRSRLIRRIRRGGTFRVRAVAIDANGRRSRTASKRFRVRTRN